MKVEVTFWFAVASTAGQWAHSFNCDLSQSEYNDFTLRAGKAMIEQSQLEIIANNGTRMINMRYVTNYLIEKATG